MCMSVRKCMCEYCTTYTRNNTHARRVASQAGAQTFSPWTAGTPRRCRPTGSAQPSSCKLEEEAIISFIDGYVYVYVYVNVCNFCCGGWGGVCYRVG